MPITFKERAVTLRALAECEQLLTLRKCGIRAQNNLVRESHHPELGRALEEGVWPAEEPPARALLQDGGISQPERVRLRAWAEVTDHITVNDPRMVDGL